MSKIIFNINRLLIVIFLTGILSGCRNKTKITTLRLGHGHEVSHPVHAAMLHLAETVQKLSDGEMIIRIYPSAQLGNEREMIELLQIGSLDITKVSSAVMENFSEEFEVFSYPYLFSDNAHYQRFLQSDVSNYILLKTEQFRLHGLCFLNAGSRNFYTRNVAVKEPKDLNGLKIRVMQSNTALRMAKSLGASPTPIPQAELYTSIQQGIVDGAENNPTTFYSKKHYEVCKYFIKSEHNFVPDVVLMSSNTYKRLTKQEKEWITTAIKETIGFYNKIWNEREAEIMKLLRKDNIQIIQPDKSKFIEKANSFYNKLQDKELIQIVKKTQAL